MALAFFEEDHEGEGLSLRDQQIIRCLGLGYHYHFLKTPR